jgi:hypothetical protein
LWPVADKTGQYADPPDVIEPRRYARADRVGGFGPGDGGWRREVIKWKPSASPGVRPQNIWLLVGRP